MVFGYKTKFQRFNGLFFETVAGLITLEEPEISRPAVQTTEIDETSGFHSYQATPVADPGELAVVLEWNQTDQQQVSIFNDLQSPIPRVYRTVYPDGETFTFRGFPTSWGKTVSLEDRISRNVSFKLSNSLLGGINLLTESVDTWVAPSTGTQGDYTSQGDDSIVSIAGPLTITQPVWRVTTDATTPNVEGGFRYDVDNAGEGLDHTESYRLSCWIKQSALAPTGGIYFGCGDNSDTTDLGGTPVADPFFLEDIDLPSTNTWFLFIGIIHGSAFAGADSGVAGIYDSTGAKIVDGAEFKIANAATTQAIRVLVQDYVVASETVDIAAPRFELLSDAIPINYLLGL